MMMMQTDPLEPRVAALEAAQNENTQTLRWVVAKLGRVTAVQDEHTLRFDRVEERLDGVEARLEGVEGRLDRVEGRLGKVEGRLGRVEQGLAGVQADLAGLRRDLPGMMAEVMREVLKEVGKS